MLLMCTSTLRGRSSPASASRRPVGARERHVAHVVRAAVRDAQPRELVVAPERAVHEHEVARGEPGEHAVVQAGEPGDVGDDAAGRASRKTNPVASSSPAWNGSTTRLDPSSGVRALRFERRAIRRRRSAPACAAACPSSARSTPAAPKTRTGVADSRSSSSPAVWSISASVSSTPAIGGARTPSTSPRVERLELLTQVRRGVDEKPRPLAAADRQRRLRARPRPHPRARGLARPATAVPLRKASSGGRAQNADAHGPGLQIPTAGTRRR